MLKQTRTTARKAERIDQQVAEFLASGGKITQLEPYDRGYNNTLRHCRCGCRGIVEKHCEKRMKAKERDFPFEGLKDI